MEKTLKRHRFLIYILFFLLLIILSIGTEYRLLYPLFLLLLIFLFEFNKESFNEEKVDFDKQFLLDFFQSILFSSSIYVILYSIGVYFNYNSHVKSELDFSIFNLITIVFLYPIFEEFFFRKLFLKFYNINRTISLTILNGLLFCIAHVFSETPFLNAFMFGCCFYLIYLKKKKIIFSVLTHIFINSLLFITYHNQDKLVEFVKSNNLFVFLISFLSTVLFFYTYFNYNYKKRSV